MKVYEFAQTSSSSKSSRGLPFSADASRAYYDWNRVRQPVMADEVQTFKALITIHKVLQEGHPITVKEAQQNVNWIESLARGVVGEGLRGMVTKIPVTRTLTECAGIITI
jgi:ANTH domain